MRRGTTRRSVTRMAGAFVLFGGLGMFSATGANAQNAGSCGQPAVDCCKQYEEAATTLSKEYERVLKCAGEASCCESCVPTAESCGGCGTCGGCDGCGCGVANWWELGDPWTLNGALYGDCEPTIPIAGFFDFGWQSDHDGAFTGNGPFLDDHEWKNFNLMQMYLYSEKVADGSCGLGWGYRADLVYGVDGNEAQSFGNNPGTWDFANGWDHGTYEWAMPQLYGEVAYNNLSVKIGHWYTLIGYEVVPATGNFFLSRQINFYNSEPFTHTGAIATYKANDKLSVHGGYILGWDTGFDQLNQGSAGHVGFSYAFSENTSFSYHNLFGDFGWRANGDVQCFILTQNWTERFSTVHQFDILGTDNGTDPVAPGGNFAVDGIPGDSTGFINYAFYEINDNLKAGTRVEWYKADGISYYTWTYGVNIKPHANLIVRPEVRHLWAPGSQTGAPGSIASNVRDVYGNATVFGIDAIVTF